MYFELITVNKAIMSSSGNGLLAAQRRTII